MNKPGDNGTLSVYYDGQCPFCSRYMQLYRLQQGEYELVLIDVRSDPAKVAEFTGQGFDIDNGMVVDLDGTRYAGARAMQVLALLSSPSDLFNRINQWVFSRPRLAKVLYPVLVAGRNLTLRLLGREKIIPGRGNILRPLATYMPQALTTPLLQGLQRYPLLEWLTRATALAFIFLLIEQLLLGYLRWSGADYTQPVLWLDLVLRFGPAGIVVAVIAAIVGLRYTTISSPWTAFAQGHELRWFIVILCLVLAWPLATLGHNYYFDQEYVQDKVLLLVLLPLIYYRPLFIFPFLLLAYLIFWQLAEPMLGNGAHFNFKLQVLQVLGMFAALCLYCAITGDRRIDLFLVFTLSLMASAYWQPAFAKMKLNWLLHGDLYHMPLAAHAHGWLASWSNESVVRFAKLVSTFDWPMRIGVLAVEIGSLFMLFRRRITVALLCALSAFHMGVFVLYGYLIWTWIALDLAVAVLLWRDREKQQYKIFNAQNLALSALLILTSNYWGSFSVLGWYDTRLNYTFHYRGRGESGTEYVIPPGFYTPYEDVFSMSSFSYLVDQHLNVVGPYGITMSTERAIALQRATSKGLVIASEEMLGKYTFSAQRTARFEQFLQCYIKNRNEGEKDSVLSKYLRAPVQLWTARQGNIYTGQEPLTDVFVNEVTTLYDDETLRQIRDLQVLHIVPKCELQPNKSQHW